VTTAAPEKIAGMAAEVFRNVPLLAHPRDSAGPVSSLSVSGTLHPSGNLTLEFQLTAELSALRLVPSVCQPQRRNELWRHTCFELFARRDSQAGYCEFNFSPSGDWAAYRFDSYRSTPQEAKQSPIEVILHTSGVAQIGVRARIDLLSAFEKQAVATDLVDWRLNCAAVIESTDGSLTYWAVHHPGPKPDFHDAAGFRIIVNSSGAVVESQGLKQ
jgi:hypothetical protein